MKEEQFAQCMKRIAAGDRDGLKEIYAEYLPYLYSVVYGVLQHKETAEDVTSDVFLRIWNTADKYKPGGGHKAYLATIARNMAIDELRKRKREVLMSGNTGEDDEGAGPDEIGRAASGDTGPEEEVIEDLALKEALDRLKPAEREVVSMKILSEMTFQEISQALNVPMGTITWRYQAAIKKLKRYGYE